MGQNFNNLLKEYESNKKDESKKYQINILQLQTYDFISTDLFKNNPIMYNDKMWWRWDQEYKKWYMIDDVKVIMDFNDNFVLQGINGSVFHSNIRTAILNALKQAGLLFKEKFKQEIKPTWIVFKDCIVDVETGETFDHDFVYFATNPLPYNYLASDNTDTSKIDKLFRDWVVDKEGKTQDETWVQTLYEVFAYAMLPDYPIETIFVLHGDGSNGKSSAIKLLVNFLGAYNCSATELSLLSNPNSRFETTALFKKLVCLMSELDDSTLKNTSLLKKLTGNKELIRGEFKGKGQINFINYAKLIMSTNVIPDTADKTDGFYRRFLLVDFPNKFDATQGDVLKNLTIEDYEALARKLIKILQDILKKNTFTNLGTIKDRKQRYEDKANPLKRFIDEQCVVSMAEEIPVFEFYEVFASYLAEKGYRVISKSKLSRLMKENGYEVEPKHNPDVGKTWRYYIGINLKQEKYPEVKVYNQETKEFEEVKEFRNIEYDKEYTFEDIQKIFASYSASELSDILKSWKKQGALTEIRSGIFRFENQKGGNE
jgi:P4 family phage/plasmid primase-like protien